MAIENSCKFIGNFVADPVGKTVRNRDGEETRNVRFKLGVNNRRSGKSAFPQFEIWGKAAEVIEKYCGRGDRIAVEAELISDTWEDKETGETRYADKFKVIEYTFLGGKRRDDEGVEQEDEESEEEEASPAPRRSAKSEPVAVATKAKTSKTAKNAKKDDDVPF